MTLSPIAAGAVALEGSAALSVSSAGTIADSACAMNAGRGPALLLADGLAASCKRNGAPGAAAEASGASKQSSSVAAAAAPAEEEEVPVMAVSMLPAAAAGCAEEAWDEGREACRSTQLSKPVLAAPAATAPALVELASANGAAAGSATAVAANCKTVPVDGGEGDEMASLHRGAIAAAVLAACSGIDAIAAAVPLAVPGAGTLAAVTAAAASPS